MSDVLLPQMVEALQDNVELHLGFIHHGRMVDPIVRHQGAYSYDLGPAVLGVTDADFGVIHDLVEPLQPGDLLCHESYAGRQADSPAVTISNLDTTLRRSAFVGERKAPTRAKDSGTGRSVVEAICNQGDPDSTDLVSRTPAHAAAVLEGAELLRRYQLDSPLVGCADSLAVAKGVRVQVADSSPQRYAVTSERVRFGNTDMVCELGRAAICTKWTEPSRKPVLAFAAGSGHKGIERILRDAGVPFVSQESRQPLVYRLRRELLMLLGEQAVMAGFGGQWERNANRAYRTEHR